MRSIHILRLLLIRIKPGIFRLIFSQFSLPIVSTCHNGVTQFPDLRSGKSYASLSSGGYITPPGATSILYHQMTTNSAHIPRSTDATNLKFSTGSTRELLIIRKYLNLLKPNNMKNLFILLTLSLFIISFVRAGRYSETGNIKTCPVYIWNRPL